MSLVPMVLEQSPRGERVMDLFSKMLAERVIFLNGPFNDNMSHLICAQLLYLESVDSTKDISLYINSPGGSVTSGLAIRDTMNFIKCDVSTIVMGMAASMGALIATSGTKGKRFALPDSTIMIHQVSSGTQGTVMDQEIALKESIRLNDRLHDILCENASGKYTHQEMKDLCGRDRYLSPQQTVDMALIDGVISQRA